MTATPLQTCVRPLLVAGVATAGAGELSVRFPYDGTEVGRVALADAALLERTLAAADAAREELAAVPAFERAEVLERAAALVAERRELLARETTLETGNAIWETRLEVGRVAEVLGAASHEARRLTGETIPIDGWPNGRGRIAYTRRFPVGTVLGITPFNAPLLLVAHKLAPAFAAGNPCVIRPASKTPLSALSLGEILLEAGAPPASVSVVPCPTVLAESLVADDRVKAVSFTGSAAVGWRLRALSRTPRVTLELGGNGAVIVHRDADVAYAASRCAFGAFLRAGQTCISVQRLYVERSIADELTERLLAEVAALTTGDPLDEGVRIGCLVSETAAEEAMAVVGEAVTAGATVLCGGSRTGTTMEPTVLAGVPEAHRACREELFAPIVAVLPYDDVDDAIAAAGDTAYGLQAGIFTNDVRIIHRAHDRLEVGALIVNDVNTFRVDHMPYGGARRSGTGREGVRYAMRELSEERMLVLDPR